MPLYPVPREPSEGEPKTGFRAELRGMSLFDLVQLECQRDAGRRALRVVAQAESGLLCFEGSRLVHAETRTERGEAAVLRLLRLEGGQVEEARVPVPLPETIHASWQSLLLRAAHAEDEERRLDRDASSPRIRVPELPDETLALEDDDLLEIEPTEARTSMPAMRGRGVRLTVKGELLEKKGDASDLAERSAFVARLGDLIGAYLGLDRLVRVDAVRGNERVAIARADGSLVAVEGPRELEPNELVKEVFR